MIILRQYIHIGGFGCGGLSYLNLQKVLRHTIDLLETLRMCLPPRARETRWQTELRARARGCYLAVLLLLSIVVVVVVLLLRGRVDGARVDALHPDEFANS